MGGEGIDAIDSAFIEQLFLNNEVSITEPADAREFIKLHRRYIIDHIHSEVVPDDKVFLAGLPLLPGFTHLYGAPDTCRSHIGATICNEGIKKDMQTVFVDAENKLEHGKLHPDVIYVRGTSKTPEVIKKLTNDGVADLVVVDTIVSLSRYSDMMRSAVKVLAPTGRRMLLLNQTRSHKYGHTPAGTDMITSMSRANHRIVQRRTQGNRIYVVTDTKHWFVFDITDQGLVYSREETLLATAQSQGSIKKIRNKYIIDGVEYSKADALNKLDSVGIVNPTTETSGQE